VWWRRTAGRNINCNGDINAATAAKLKRPEMKLLSLLLGCRHRRTTFPMTAGGRTYVCCVSCGREFEYDWRAMRRLTNRWSEHRKHN
jgi:hypothetical protein